MKKLLIPILATTAIAPVATSMVACGSSTFNLKFSTILGESEGFFLDGFKIEANREYKFAADFSNVPDAVLADWGEDPLCFAGFFIKESIDDLKPLKIAQDKLKVVLNDKDITSEIDPPGENQPIWIGQGHGWKKTDKLVITVVWTESQKSAIVGLIPQNL